jgi:hypothetical protein
MAIRVMLFRSRPSGYPVISTGRPVAPGAAGTRISSTPFLNEAFTWSVVVPGGKAIVRKKAP